MGNPENANSAIEQFTYVGDIHDDLERAKLSVFATIVQEPMFDQLRAKEQLGYIVSRLKFERQGVDADYPRFTTAGLIWISSLHLLHGTTSHCAE